MSGRTSAELLEVIWANQSERQTYNTTDGGEVMVISPGERDSEGIFSGAVIELNGKAMHGDIVFGEGMYCTKYTILHINDAPADRVVSISGERIAQIVLNVAPEAERALERIKSDPSRQSCASYLVSLDALRRTRLFEQLSLENLRRKSEDIKAVFEASDRDWHQTMLVMLFRAMGGNRNRQPYMRLAERVTYHAILRERSSVMLVEALLLGTSGLLEGCYYDDYIKGLKEHYSYLQNKYGLEPMRAEEWETGRNRPADDLVIRLVQLASLLADNDFLFDRVISCRCREDMHNLFKAEASLYWTTHFRPDERGREFPKRLGKTKSDLLGINLVIPMMFTYGEMTGKEDLKSMAVSLYETIPAESNSVLRPWTGMDVPLAHAQDSQALLQLNKAYCSLQRCAHCPIGRPMIKKYF